MLDDTSPTTKTVINNRQLMNEMRTQNFDVIRFATYRTACKLRFIQRKTNLALVDLWNVIESFRDNGLNTMELNAEISVGKLEEVLSSIFCQLNMRIPTFQQFPEEQCINTLTNWLVGAYNKDGCDRIKVFSVKVALTTMCSGKLVDKLRYIFSQISDASGIMVRGLFNGYLKEILLLPGAVLETPSFGYTEATARSFFDVKIRVTVNDFLDTLMSDPGPQCLMWLPILHRMIAVENVFHPVQCEGCHRESFVGFRYKCQRCYNYHLCQDCFWRGRTSGNHTNDHEMKEYSSYKSPSKQIGQKLRNSFRCAPSKSNNKIPHFPETPEKTLDLTHIVPASPIPMHNGFPEVSINRSIDLSSLDSSSGAKSPSRMNSSTDSARMNSSVESNRIDDEHRLIARYAARLAADTNNGSRSPTEINYTVDASREQRELINQLEMKNREIMREIQRLRQEQQEVGSYPSMDGSPNPTLLGELRVLRQRKDALETRMSRLQENRRNLMVQLESLMKLLKNHPGSPSTPNSSPRSRVPISPPHSLSRTYQTSPSTPGDSLSGVGGDVKQAFNQPSTANNMRSLRNDLLLAADSVTNAMSSLVKELNSETSDDEGDENNKKLSKKSKEFEDILDTYRSERDWREEKHMIFSSSRGTNGSYLSTQNDRRQDGSPEINQRELLTQYHTDNESYLHSDAESYIRTDDEDGGGTDWEESAKRWVNR